MPKYPRAELQEMMNRWIEANHQAEVERDWVKHLGPHYTDDAEYTWNVGPHEDFVAHGRKQIETFAFGYQMRGFEDWEYPYERVLIDEELGEVVAFWRQIPPYKRPDGSPYVVEGLSGSWFRYGGDFKWCWQKDFFDLGNVMAVLLELAADGHLNPVVKKKIQLAARGEAVPGHVKLRQGSAMSQMIRRMKGGLAMARIALLGR